MDWKLKEENIDLGLLPRRCVFTVQRKSQIWNPENFSYKARGISPITSCSSHNTDSKKKFVFQSIKPWKHSFYFLIIFKLEKSNLPFFL